jgi:DNA anti-recombination protein RmuC
MTADADPGGRLQAAAKRLEHVVLMLEQRLASRLAEASAAAGGLIDRERAQLAAELDAARGRQRELEEAGAQASAALARAIGEIRGTLGRTEG